MKIDISKWKGFPIGSVFVIQRPCARSSKKYTSGEIPFVASGNYNNGVIAYLCPKPQEVLDAGNCLSVSPVDGSTFYQENDFLGRGGAGSSIILLYNKNLNKKNALFVSTVVRAALKKYAYNDMGNKDSIKDEIIKLPTDINGQPDWQYMERYMQRIEAQAKANLQGLQTIAG